MKYIVPQDWDGSSWKCVVVMWPDSEGWLSLLRGQISQMMRGRTYEEASGEISAAQEVGRQIWLRNNPLVDCDGEPATVPENIETIYICGGSADEDDESMAVDRVYIDQETGELVVQSGQCCEQRFSLVSAVLNADPETDLLPDDEFGSQPEYTACAKVKALSAAMWDIADNVFDYADNISADTFVPWKMAAEITKLYPNVNFSIQELSRGVALALVLISAGLEDETFDPGLRANIECRMEVKTPAGREGVDNATYQAYQSIMELSAFDYYGVGVGIDMVSIGAFWQSILMAFKRSGVKAITSGVVASGAELCACPDAPQAYDWEIVYDFLVNDQGWSMAAGEGNGWSSGIGWYLNGPGTDAFIRINAGQTFGPRAGVLTYARLEFAVSPPADGTVVGDAVWFLGASGGNSITGVISSEEIRAAAALGFVEKAVNKPWSLGAAASLRLYVTTRETLLSGEQIAFRRLVLRGTGDKPSKDAVI